jgi:oligopeptide/dipeptide ABC transporter ATP-binding protein
MTNENLVEIRGLVVGYKGKGGFGKAVDAVDLSIRRGEALGLVGESGCGKTTLGLSLLQLNRPGKVLAGSVKVGSTEVLALKGEDLRRYRWKTTAMIFQSAMNALDPVKTIESQIVETMMQHSKVTKEEAKSKVADLLRLVNIDPSRVSAYQHELSGGMKQRVVIAMSLCLDPKLLIADEPSTALDVVVQASILRTLKRLKEELGLTVILISHDISIMPRMTDRLAVMYAGKIVEIGPTAQVLGNPQHPYTQALLKAMPTIGVQSKIQGIPGGLPSIFERPAGCRFHPRCPYAFDRCKAEEPSLVGKEHDASCWLVNK